MRARPVLVLACLAAVAPGCGGGGEAAAPRALLPVELEVTAPSDLTVVDDDTVVVRGTVRPAGAGVRVMGLPAQVSGGSFEAAVPVEPGANVIDVMATARNRAATLTAVRVTRELPVVVPELVGLEVPDAEDELRDAGLTAEVREDGGLFDGLLPGEPEVCEQDPEAGEEVRRGTAVTLTVAKGC